MKVLVVEPHPDDTCLSFYESLKKISAGCDVSLLSVASNFYNGYRDSEKFCERIGVEFLEPGGLDDLLFKENRVSHHEIRKSDAPNQFQRTQYMAGFPDVLADIQGLLLMRYQGKFDSVITGIGIYHPYHVLVTIAVERAFMRDVYFWGDYPYIKRKYGEKIRDDVLKGGSVIARVPVDVNEKETAFVQCYPSEKNIMRFDHEGLERDEILVAKHSLKYEKRNINKLVRLLLA